MRLKNTVPTLGSISGGAEETTLPSQRFRAVGAGLGFRAAVPVSGFHCPVALPSVWLWKARCGGGAAGESTVVTVPP